MALQTFPRSLAPPRIALKVDVNTLRGTALGVPRIVELLGRHRAGATFLFTLGPDRTGRAIGRILRRNLYGNAGRTSMLRQYGFAALFYGTLLPGPEIGRKCADTLRKVRDAGFETGIHAWDRVRWRSGAPDADAQWTASEMQRAVECYERIFGAPPRVHGAVDWQMNVHGFRLTQRLGFDFCSDTRGFCPYIPVIDAEIVACPQIPTTLPTIEELIGSGHSNVQNVGERILQLAADSPAPAGHVYTLQAEIEGLELLPVLDTLLQAWREAGIQLLSLGSYLEAAGESSLPRHRTATDRVPGRDGTVAVQGPEFLPRPHTA